MIVSIVPARSGFLRHTLIYVGVLLLGTFGLALAAASTGNVAAAAPATESLTQLLTNPIVSGILLTIGMLGLLVEMQTLHGIAGTIGILALALFFGSHLYAGDATIWVIGLAIIGLFGILWELHVVPGHGAPGVLGAVALLLAVLWAFGLMLFVIALETVSTSIVLTVIFFALAVRVFPENAWMKKLAFHGVQGHEYVTSADFSALQGASGTAISFLRPSGVALLDGRRIDVLTEGEFIAQGTPIHVTRVAGARIFVEPVRLPNYKAEI